MIIDEEEFLLILKLKDLKKQYRTEYQDLRDLRAEIQYCQHLVDQCRNRLLTGAPLGKVGESSEVPGGTGQGHPGFQKQLWSFSLAEAGAGQGLQMCVFRTLQAGDGDGKGKTLEQEVTEGEPATGTKQAHLAFACFSGTSSHLTVLSPASLQNLTSGTMSPSSSPRTCRWH